MSLSKTELEAHLWGAADILRGSIDAADYKHYIFGLLFFKRISDVWDEEFEAAKADHGAEAAKAEIFHRINLPDGCHWADVRQHAEQIGTHLTTAFRQIEDANLQLKGVFQDVDFAHQERFPDHLIEKLLQHFEKIPMGKADVPVAMMGDAYEYLIAQFADDAGKKGGEFYTPKEVVRLMVRILEPQPGQSVYDPTCGAGGMLLECMRQARAADPEAVLRLYGQEKNLNTWAICKMALFLHGIDDVFIERGDTLREPKFLDVHGGVQTFDRVIANPPFSLKSWGHDLWKKGDPHGRDVYGCPPKSYGDLAFVQHMIASMKPAGRMAVVVPHGVLFRGGAEGKIRTAMLEADLIEAVVGLGPNLFYGTGIPAAVLYLNRAKVAARRGKVLIVDGSTEVIWGRRQSRLSDDGISRIEDAIRGWRVTAHFSRSVPLDELRRHDFSLEPTPHIEPLPALDAGDVQRLVELIVINETSREIRRLGIDRLVVAQIEEKAKPWDQVQAELLELNRMNTEGTPAPLDSYLRNCELHAKVDGKVIRELRAKVSRANSRTHLPPWTLRRRSRYKLR